MTYIIINTYWLALCIYHEARGEPDVVKTGVAHVVMNRVSDRGMSARDVIHENKQFSWYEHGMTIVIKEPEAMEHCLLMAKKCLEQRMNGDTFGGANYFHDTSVTPYWADDFVYLGQFGNIKFYKG